MDIDAMIDKSTDGDAPAPQSVHVTKPAYILGERKNGLRRLGSGAASMSK